MSPPPGKPSTFDLLRWSDTPDEPPVRTPGRVSATNDSKGFASAADESFRETPAAPRSSNRKPAGGPSTFAFSEQISEEEAEALLKRKPLSETKKKEMSGNKLFSDDPNGIPSTPERVAGAKLVQPPSQISFGESGRVSPKRPATPAEIAKQRELSGTQQTVDNVQWRRLNSNAKAKELVGSNIFSESPPEDESTPDAPLPPPSPPPPTPLALGTPGRATTPERRRAMAQKTAELSGHDIFKKDPTKTPVEKHISSAKLKEMSGHDIFADGKPVPRECLGGVRKPPDVAAKIQQFDGTNPALPDLEASAELMAHPKRMSDKHISGTKIKEIVGNYDLFCGQDCLDPGKVPLNTIQGSTTSLAKRRELIGTDALPPASSGSHCYECLGQAEASQKYHGQVKRQEILGNYDGLLSYEPQSQGKQGDYIKYTPERAVSNAKRRELLGNNIFE